MDIYFGLSLVRQVSRARVLVMGNAHLNHRLYQALSS